MPFHESSPHLSSATSVIRQSFAKSEASSPELDERASTSSVDAEQKTRRAKRGRPQQDIADNLEDPYSAKRKHRRLYARQYRAQMRQKVDEVQKLKEELAEEVKKRHEEVERLNNVILNLVHIITVGNMVPPHCLLPAQTTL